MSAVVHLVHGVVWKRGEQWYAQPHGIPRIFKVRHRLHGERLVRKLGRRR